MRYSILIALFCFSLISSAFAQEHRFAIHVANPLLLFQKAGVKLEYRTDRLGILLTGAKYYGWVPRYPGVQGGAELRLYGKNEEQKRHEKFFYSRLIIGHLDYFGGSGEGFTHVRPVPESMYYGIGAGWGKRFNYKHLFIDFNTGLKFTLPEVKQEKAFYITGPGGYVDLRLSLGFQF